MYKELSMKRRRPANHLPTQMSSFQFCFMSLKSQDLKHLHILPCGHPDGPQLAAVPSDQTGCVGSRQERAAASEPRVLSGLKGRRSLMQIQNPGVVVGVMFALTTT